MDLPQEQEQFDRLTPEESRFLSANRFYCVKVARSACSRHRRAFGVCDVVQAAFLAWVEAALAWRRLTGRPATDFMFVRFARVRIRHACYAFMISNESAVSRSPDLVRRARAGRGTPETRARLLEAGRARPLSLASARRGVRRGRIGLPFLRAATDGPAAIPAGARTLVRDALGAEAGRYAGRRGEAAGLIVDERMPYRAGFQLSCGAIGELTGLRRQQVENMQYRIVRRAERALRKEVGAGGERPADANTGTPASAGGGDDGSGPADSTAGVCDGLAVGRFAGHARG